MAYLTRAGANPANLSGIEARGYHVFRRANRVRVVWGPIEFRRTRTVVPMWSRATLYKDFREATPADAARLLRKIVRERLSEGYSQLPRGCRILPATHASGITRRP
jgi:hypothetical protein